jgi:hypothetical protein
MTHKPCDSSRPKGLALQQALTQVGVTALRMEGEITKPLQVRAMREKRQKEYAALAYQFLCNNLDWYYLHDVLNPSTIPVDALAHEVATDYHRQTARDLYRDHLWQWIDSQQIRFVDGDTNPDCTSCFDTGKSFDPSLHSTALGQFDISLTNCTQCMKGNQ